MTFLHSIRIESPRTDSGVVGHYILQQKMAKKILALKLDWAKFNVKEFKEIYHGVVTEMSMDRLTKLQALTDEEEIVKFLRKKGNRVKPEKES